MMAKITKGRGFGGAVRYVMQEAKEAKLLDSKDVLTTSKESIIHSFCLQSQLRPRVAVVVGHISLDFSAEDVDKIDDDLMRQVAQEYMQRMHILNTQYILVRHYDREHPHCHLVFNRIDNNGRLISDKNDRVRSAKICKELTEKHHLHMAKGKDHVHRERLRGADAVKYQIYDALVSVTPKCKNWEELRSALMKHGISMHFVHRGNTTEIQGIVFEKDGLHFNGSKVDRQFSFSKISRTLVENANRERRSSWQGQNVRRGSSFGRTAMSMASSTADAASSIGSSIISGATHVLTVAATPSVSGDGSSVGGGSSIDLADDEYIDEYGIRRKKRRGMRR